MDKWVLDKILEITSLIKYNEEKRDFIEKALKQFLVNPVKEFSIEAEMQKHFKNNPSKEDKNNHKDVKNIFSLDSMFEMQDYVLTVDVGLEDLEFYLVEKYTNYNPKLKSEIGITITDIINFAFLLRDVYNFNLINGGYDYSKTIFSSKEEMFCIYNLRYPDDADKKALKNASIITKNSLIFLLETQLKDEKMKPIIENMDKLFNLLSFTMDDIRKDNKLRFQDKPLLKFDEESYIITNEIHLIWGLPFRLDSFLNKYSWFTDNKGKAFENVVYKVLNKINQNKRLGGNFFPDIRYGELNKYQLDGLINFKSSSWFIECKGRIPRADSFKGDAQSVEQDLKKGIIIAENQAIRAINLSEANQKIGDIIVKEKKGILIIAEGMYPNLNQNPITYFKGKDEKYPRYIISFFSLMEMLRQYDRYYFEKFLEWRSDSDMPLYCMSELDYWDYFTQMQNGLDKKENYDAAKKRKIKVIFNGKRFNAPKFIKFD